MASFYTPPSLPRTPIDYTMNATLPSLPTELLSSWSVWRHPKQTPLTPPMTSTIHTRRAQPQPQQRVQTTLPPIAHLERHLPTMQPPTPPEDLPLPKYSPRPTRLPPIITHPEEHAPQETIDVFQPKASTSSETPHLDWLDFTRTRSAHFIAEKTCEMICYLWFSTSSPEQSYPSPNNSPPLLRRPSSSTSTLQLVATPTFVQFMQKLLETTQVSQSVIVLSLHYIYRLKERNHFTPAQPGSEFRIAVAGLMMANKFLDDLTYTNKTWSEVSGIDLPEINRMEREFLMGVDFSLYVDKPTYESWLNLLKGLVWAKERDSRHFRKSRGTARTSRLANPTSSTGPVSRTYSTRHRPSTHRARSTSPTQMRTPVYPYSAYSTPSHALPAPPEQLSPTPRSGAKRSAEAAFSPTSATFAEIPSKRPLSMALQIPEFRANNSGPHSHSPLESLKSFSSMSLASPHAPQPLHRSQIQNWAPSSREVVPETLVTPVPLDEGRRAAVPQNLYFYALAGSPMETEEENRPRKARLRYHQPPPPSAVPYYVPQRATIPVVQSASTSPHEHHMHVTSYTLPHFHDTQWSRPPNMSTPSFNPQPTTRYTSQKTITESPIPSAPFANAGPPGVHFYPTPIQNSSAYPPNWSRGRHY
ncbi:cyclin-domain-containing protein [Collybia nuda]|uniref:Cyclin-domain-containing protein n=1 Tax=Collybia nuda TaxID=64659 RepID=A0A9P5YE71_9AGAR|nr:cyclin-domain-containing protein [Collybia nuda]